MQTTAAEKQPGKDAEIERLTRELREANRQIIYVHDEDSFSVRLNIILVHDEGRAGHVKAMLVMSDWQRTALIRELLENKMGLIEEDDKTCLNMAWVWEV